MSRLTLEEREFLVKLLNEHVEKERPLTIKSLKEIELVESVMRKLYISTTSIEEFKKRYRLDEFMR